MLVKRLDPLTLWAAGSALVARLALRSALVAAQLDELAGDPGLRQRRLGTGRQLGGELDQGEVGTDLDVAEVSAVEATLVGQRTDDLTRLDLVALADRDPVR